MDNRKAVGLTVLAMAVFTVEDTLIKLLSATLPVGQILLCLGCGGTLIFAALSRVSGHRFAAPEVWHPLPLIRGASEGVAVSSFVVALSTIDISVVAAVFQATPLVITMGAALFLGEAVGWRRWSAIGVGFAGVVLIIRPGLSGFQPEVLIILVTVVAIATRDLVTRRLDPRLPSLIVAAQGFAGAAIAGALLLWLSGDSWQPVTLNELCGLGAAVLFGTCGYYAIVQSMRLGEASAVMPFRYTRLVFALIIGMLVFGERPDLPMLVGSGLIIGTGLYTFVRERRLARRQRAAA